MSGLSRHHHSHAAGTPLSRGPGGSSKWSSSWQPDALALTDEAHLVATSSDPLARAQFAGSMGQFIQGIRDAEVCPLYGRHITDLESLCYQLERAIPADVARGVVLERRIDGPRGITNLLRQRETFRGRPASKFRYYLWHDADVLLQADRSLFSRVVDAIAGVAAEAEYVSDDMLLIHRLIAVGGEPLSLYAGDAAGQMRTWFDDGCGEPFWSVVTGIEAPRFENRAIEGLVI